MQRFGSSTLPPESFEGVILDSWEGDPVIPISGAIGTRLGLNFFDFFEFYGGFKFFVYVGYVFEFKKPVFLLD